MLEIEVTHTADTGHRIPGHDGGKGKCARLHGHTYGYRIVLTGNGDLDGNGFLVDFGVVKAMIDEWDHRTLLWQDDPLASKIAGTFGVILTDFIPTAENMAAHLADRLMAMPRVRGVTVELKETPKTTARAVR